MVARRLCLLVIAALLGMVSVVYADTTCTLYIDDDVPVAGSQFSSASDACTAYDSSHDSGGVTQSYTYTPEEPENGRCDAVHTVHYDDGSYPDGSGTISDAATYHTITATGSACPTQCTSGQYLTMAEGTSPPGTICSSGCSYTAESGAPTITNALSGSPFTLETYQSTGGTCSGSASGTQVSGSQSGCVSQSGNTYCVSGSQNEATVNGDVIAPADLDGEGCAQFADGSMVCPSTASQPTVSSGSSSSSGGTTTTQATPTATVTETATGGSSSGGTLTDNYYSASTVANSTSTTAVTAGSTTSSTGLSGSSSGGTSTGSSCGSAPTDSCYVSVVPSASNGDCGSTGDCSVVTGDFPSTSTTDTYSGVIQDFVTAVEQAPLLQGYSAIESAWPSGGSCSVGTVTLTTLNNATVNYGTTFCDVYENDVAPYVSTIMLACWCVLGAIIILTA